ncbi:MAG: type II toxin-antitoxin system VapC family toxin [Acidobacteriota bacterium]
MSFSEGFLLDTNAWIGVLNETSPALCANFKLREASEILICSVVKSELLYGARRGHRMAENLRLLHELFEDFRSLPFDDECAATCGVIRAELARLGQPIGPVDFLIAATALAHNVTLVTHNTRELARVPGLAVVDWEVDSGPFVARDRPAPSSSWARRDRRAARDRAAGRRRRVRARKTALV